MNLERRQKNFRNRRKNYRGSMISFRLRNKSFNRYMCEDSIYLF